MNEKDLVFISHAAPENNDFATWLSTRLTALGYRVWVELRQLEAGDRFWPEIEAAIRRRTARFVTVVSKPATNKFGYRRELSMADAVERGSVPGFLIPVRLDGIEHFDVPAEVHDKHLLDFSNGWHHGLASLVQRLEKDCVPRQVTAVTPPIVANGERHSPIKLEELLVSNWLEAESVPAGIRLHQFEGEPVSQLTFKGEWPSRVIGSVVVTFARANDFSGRKYYRGKITTSEMLVEAFLAPKCPSLPTLSANDRFAILVDLIRQGWERHMSKLGLRAYELASSRLTWYLPWTLSEGKQLQFVDAAGKTGRRALNGESQKLSSRWHFAVSPNVFVKPTFKIGFNYTVVFTSDGLEPLTDKVKAHRFRRSFCKSWWQDRWRDMLAAYVSFLKGKEAALVIPLASDRALQFAPHLAAFSAPFSALEPIRISQLSDELADSLVEDVQDDEIEGDSISDDDGNNTEVFA